MTAAAPTALTDGETVYVPASIGRPIPFLALTDLGVTHDRH